MQLVRRIAVATALVIAWTIPAGAAESGTDLVDVSKQFATLQHGFSAYAAKHGSIRSGRLSAALAECGEETTVNAFEQWGDPADYFLAPQGDFSRSDRWDMNDRAQVDAEGDNDLLSLGDGGEAVSPVLCITPDRPTIRFFARNDGGADESRLEVSVLYEGTDGKVQRLKVARLRAGDDWQPAIAIPLYVNALASFAADGTAPVAIQFRAVGVKAKLGRWQVDDLYVDPFKGH
jgi:hypothetical protein